MEDNIKKCGGCQVEKPFSEFNKCKGGKFGLHNHCRECSKLHKKKWEAENKDWVAEYWKNPINYARSRERYKIKYDNDPIFREKELKKNRDRRRSEPVRIKARKQRKKWLEIPHNRISQSLRARVRCALKGITKTAETERLLNCSFEFLKNYLESKFQPGMTWSNYGEWEIDHIIPCNYFNLEIPDNQKICFNYKNLQPLWEKDNIKKQASVNEEDLLLLNEIKKDLKLF